MPHVFPRRSLAIGAIILPLALGACTAAQQQTATDALAQAQQACTAAAPIVAMVPDALATAPASVQAVVKSLLAYEESVCASEATIAAAVTKDPSGGTAAWITNIAAGIVQVLPAILSMVGGA